MSKNTESKNDRILRKYQRRWIKPTVFTILLIIIPFLLFGLYHSKTIITATSEHNASAGEVWELIKRNDKVSYFDKTPNNKTHTIAETESDLPEKPYIIAFYLQHCPYCEAAHDNIRYNEKQLVEKYPNIKTPVVYIDVKSPIGQELIHEHQVMAASSLMLMADDESENMLVISGTQGDLGQPIDNKNEIMRIFKELDEQLARYTKHENQRNRINQ